VPRVLAGILTKNNYSKCFKSGVNNIDPPGLPSCKRVFKQQLEALE
jgi:hypothetical protein